MKSAVVAIAAILLMAAAAKADGPAADLAGYRERIRALEENASAGIITKAQADQGSERYLREAAKTAGRPVTLAELERTSAPAGTAPAPQKLTALQRAAGYVTFVNILWVLATIVGVVCFAILFIKVFVPVLVAVPVGFYEGLFYLGAAGLGLYGLTLSPNVAAYVGFTACLLLAAALGFSAHLKRAHARRPEVYSLICFAAWTAAAVAYQSQLIGFAAVLALLGALGFSVVVTPLCYSIGFKDDAAVGRATSAAFAILTGFVLIRLLGQGVPALQPFEPGALFVGSFVGYLGLLICSSRWYDGKNRNYVLFQVVTIAAGIAALFVGSVFGVSELQKIGGTFFCLYLLEKWFEIPAKSITGYAAIGLVASGAVYAFAMFVKSNPERFQHWLLVTF